MYNLDQAIMWSHLILNKHYWSYYRGVYTKAKTANCAYTLHLFVISDMKNLIGEATCGICQESFSTTVTGTFWNRIANRHIECPQRKNKKTKKKKDEIHVLSHGCPIVSDRK